jgi:hypothetical protein
MARNGQVKEAPEEEVEEIENVLELNSDELAVAMGIPALRNRLAELEAQNHELLSYMQMIDARVRQLLGEPVISQRQAHTTPSDRALALFEKDGKGKSKDALIRGIVGE